MKSWYEEIEKETQRQMSLPGQEDDGGAFWEGLYQLEQVPETYLLCDDSLLPPESIRFFYVDENWVGALIDGALAVGQNIRCVDAREQLWKGEEIRTGFLLRSSLLSSWPSVEICCYPDETGKGTKLEVLRSVKMGEETLLFLVSGVIRRVEFVEPVEGVSFGFTMDEEGHLTLPFYPLPPVEEMTEERMFERREADSSFLQVPFRKTAADGVVDIDALALELAENLESDGIPRDISALEMAAELMETPLKYSLRGGIS